MLDTTKFTTGEHILAIRLLDAAGNATVVGTRTIMFQNVVFTITTTDIARGTKNQAYRMQLTRGQRQAALYVDADLRDSPTGPLPERCRSDLRHSHGVRSVPVCGAGNGFDRRYGRRQLHVDRRVRHSDASRSSAAGLLIKAALESITHTNCYSPAACRREPGA